MRPTSLLVSALLLVSPAIQAETTPSDLLAPAPLVPEVTLPAPPPVPAAPRAPERREDEKPPAERMLDVAVIPVGTTPADRPLALAANVRRLPEGAELVAGYRTPDRGDRWIEVPFQRTAIERWEAVIPAAAVLPPSVEYYVALVQGHEAKVLLGGPAAPMHVAVELPPDEREKAKALESLGNFRQQARFRVDWIDFGPQRLNAQPQPDRYLRVESDYTYRMLKLVSAIRIGAGTLRGAAPPSAFDDRTQQPLEMPSEKVGFDYGFAEVLFGGDPIELDLRMMLGANAKGFGTGTEATLRLGRPLGTHLELGAGVIQDVGALGRLALHWDTVPKFPMAAGVEVTTLPNDGNTGVRLYYDCDWKLSRRVSAGVRVGYQARSAIYGGLAAGGNVAFLF